MSLDPEATADRRLAQVSSELAAVAGDVQEILATATSSLSRIIPATWVAVVMNPDPETSRVVAGNDTDRVMADWVGAYIAAIDSPDRVPTVGVSQQVIGSGEPLVKPRVSYEDFLKMLSPAGQAFTRARPLPHATDMVGMLLVPMRIGGAIIGTLGMFDWKADGLVNEEDLAWVQPIADRIALSLEHARLLGTARDDADRMDLVRAITLASRHGQDQRTTLRSIVEQVTGLLDVDAAEILLPSADGKDLLVAA
ncbi:MAG TPA: GAF domain-containing protein, partial [Candidatus Dormibacteraeota bacterium]|nr:GAF domain-containing protein [Candidatus Dormibacteraeota bacterium]